mmetsp:Transcript_127608/g.190233  ORF Transcript_127608/g.190233 Transcript_127608/m.190233 type:complete len:202 (+) Transcript_127608:71-676(+)
MIPKLIYFPIGGRALPIRNAFKIGKIAFEDVHVTGQEFGEAKAAGKYTFGAVPVLMLGDEQISQSNAILTWVGKQANLYPTDIKQAMYVDEVLCAVEDAGGMIGPTIHEKDETKKLQMRKELVEGKLNAWLGGLNKLAQRNGDNGFFVGNSGTVADLKANGLLNWLTSGILDGIPKTILDGFPSLIKAKEVGNKWIAEATA